MIEKRKPADFVYETDHGSKNPFDISISALVKKPDGTTFEANGFYNGDNPWIIRLSADLELKRQFVNSSGENALNGKGKSFNPKSHASIFSSCSDLYTFI